MSEVRVVLTQTSNYETFGKKLVAWGLLVGLI